MPGTGSKSAHRFRWTLRLRLTLLYAALFLVSGTALLGVTYALATGNHTVITVGRGDPSRVDIPHRQPLSAAATREHTRQLHSLLAEGGTALGIMLTVSIGLGWLMARRALRPVRAMTDKVRHISARNLHERLAIDGPDDELKDLADTFDRLLSRLDTAFEAQKRFVANASHELRTPLTLQRAAIEVALSDPSADTKQLRTLCQRVLAIGENQEQLIEALLTLATSQRGLDRHEPIDIAKVVADVLCDHHSPPFPPVSLTSDLRPACLPGSPKLVERLATNLIDNALRHNVPDGWVHITTGTDAGHAVLTVANSGAIIPHDQLGALFQPFQRFHGHTGQVDGHGLGLAIVAAIATAHEAHISAAPYATGGLRIAVRFPPPHQTTDPARPSQQAPTSS